MSNLTKREKVLLIIGLSVAIVFLSLNYLITPAYNNYFDKINRLEQLKAEKQQTIIKIAGEADVATIYNNALEKYNSIKEPYPDMMSNYDLDKLITGICLRHNLSLKSLTISAPKASDPEQIAPITEVIVKVSASVSYADLQRFINTIKNTAYIQISMFNYAAKDNGVDVDMDINVQMLNEGNGE